MIRILLCFILLFSSANVAKATIVKTTKSYTYGRLEKDIQKLKDQYNDEIEVKSIGTSYFGQNIWAVHLGKGKKNIILVGSHHGREWLTSTLLMKMLETYSEAYRSKEPLGAFSTAILDDVSIWFVPMLNPDGVSIQQNNHQLFSPFYLETLLQMNGGKSSFKRWKANGIGIDLNRQYPSGWNQLQGVSPYPSYQLYKGIKPLEAREVIALTRFVQEINPSIAVAYHSSGREIYWNYKNGKNTNRDLKIAKKVAAITKYKLGKPNKDAVGGGFTDWFITTYHKPALTIEISKLVGETNPPLSIFPEEWKRNKNVGLKLAEEAEKIP